VCTVFHACDAAGASFVGKNYDTPGSCPGAVFLNKPGVAKTAILKPPEVPARWRSRFSSVTLNPLGAEFPACGMNEAGLVVEQTTLWNTLYPDRDERPAITELQWIQCMLDICASVDDVLEAQERLRISQAQTRLQYLVVDPAGRRALVDHILGERRVHAGHRADFVIANDMLSTSEDYLAIHAGWGGTRPVRASDLSLDRFAVTTDALRRGPRPRDVEGSFALLERSRFAETRWQVVYDLSAVAAWIRTDRSGPLRIALPRSAASADTRPEFHDVYAPGPFRGLTADANLALMRAFFEDEHVRRFVRVRQGDLLAMNDAVLAAYA
jgi:choloylglycine hydrolase